MTVNNYDILKNYLYKMFSETIYNNVQIDLLKLDSYLNKLFKNETLNELKEIDFINNSYLIENSFILSLISELCNIYNLKIYYTVEDLETIQLIYNDFENRIIYNIESENETTEIYK